MKSPPENLSTYGGVMDNMEENKTNASQETNFARRWVIIAVAVMAIVIVGLVIALVQANKKNKGGDSTDLTPVPTEMP